MDLMCFVCIYVTPRPGLSDDSRAELSTLTVVDGQLVCIRHIPCAGRSQHMTIISAVRMESGGRFEHLSEYQKWRSDQDEETQ